MLPINKVVLYKHGVGYFERQGEVDGDATVELRFRSSEMNDVLKSLTVLDLGGGHISSISYESTEPIERQLEKISISIPDQNALTGFLTQTKGAKVSVEAGSVVVKGVVMGTETVAREVQGTTVWQNFVVLLVEGAAVRAFDLQELKKITFTDSSLQTDLEHLLETYFASKKKDLKGLTIFARGQGKRQLVANYVVEAPVWKTSYRLLLSKSSQEPSVIQGWALVDNTQDEDWDDVALTLVSGLPISFVHDLYSPRYKKRPVLAVEEEAAYAPPLLEEAMAAGEMESGVMSYGGGAAAPPPPPLASAPAPKMAKARRTRAAPQPLTKKQALHGGGGAPVETRTAEIGDLFQYEIAHSVTVKRNQSALVPIVQEPFEGRRVAVYNPDVREKNPMSAVKIKNTTGMTLEAGAATVLEGDSYVGEAMLDTLKPKEERLLPFSVELGCRISVDLDSRLEDVHRVKVYGGLLNLHRYRIEETLYIIKNKLDRELELYLEHRRRKGWTLTDTVEPEEKTQSFYRFRLELPPESTTRFVVIERGGDKETIGLSNVSRKEIEFWVSRSYIDEVTRSTLEEVVSLNERVEELAQGIKRRELEQRRIFENQQRLRENLQAIGSSTAEKELRQRYVTELSLEEDRLREIEGEIGVWQQEKDETVEQVNRVIRGLALERRLDS